MKIQDLNVLKFLDSTEGDFSDLSRFKFKGVYIIQDSNNEIVYVGSAYTRTIEERLKQYLKINDSGNTLRNAICKEEYNVEKVKEISIENKESAVEIIKKFKISAIKHEDLEYKLIEKTHPKYNTAGNKIKYDE